MYVYCLHTHYATLWQEPKPPPPEEQWVKSSSFVVHASYVFYWRCALFGAWFTNYMTTFTWHVSSASFYMHVHVHNIHCTCMHACMFLHLQFRCIHRYIIVNCTSFMHVLVCVCADQPSRLSVPSVAACSRTTKLSTATWDSMEALTGQRGGAQGRRERGERERERGVLTYIQLREEGAREWIILCKTICMLWPRA